MKKSIIILVLTVVLHLVIINLASNYFIPEVNLYSPGLIAYNIIWLFIALVIGSEHLVNTRS